MNPGRRPRIRSSEAFGGEGSSTTSGVDRRVSIPTTWETSPTKGPATAGSNRSRTRSQAFVVDFHCVSRSATNSARR